MLNSKISRIVFILLIPFMFSSCVELKEEIYLKKNGSGTYQLTIDMRKLKAILDTVEDDEQDKLDDIPNFMEEMEKAAMEWNKAEGISNAKSMGSNKNFIFGVRFDFTDVKSLNNAMRSNSNKINHKGDSYTFKKKVFKKLNSSITETLIHMILERSENKEQTNDILRNITYSFILETEGKIKKFTNKKAFLENKNKLSFVVPLDDLINQKISSIHQIKIK